MNRLDTEFEALKKKFGGKPHAVPSSLPPFATDLERLADADGAEEIVRDDGAKESAAPVISNPASPSGAPAAPPVQLSTPAPAPVAAIQIPQSDSADAQPAASSQGLSIPFPATPPVEAHNTAEAVNFLQRLPHPFHTLTAIQIHPVTHEKGLIETKSFAPGDWDAIAKWIEERQGRANIYWSVNPLREPKDRKALKADINEVVELQSDIDVPEGQDQEAFIAKMLAMVDRLEHAPTFIINSGGGLQLFYMLIESDRIKLNGDADIAAAEALTRGVELAVTKALGVEADATFNCDRIMRLPGTINLPDKKKVAKGRKPALAKLIAADGQKYPRTAFTPAPAAAPSGNGLQPAAKAPVALDWNHVPTDWPNSLSDLDGHEMPPKALAILRLTPAQMKSTDKFNTALELAGVEMGKPYVSRSNLHLGLAGSLKYCSTLSREQLAATLIAECFACNGHVHDKETINDKRRAVVRSMMNSHEPKRSLALPGGAISPWPDGDDDDTGRPSNTFGNTKEAITKLGVELTHDLFRNINYVHGHAIKQFEGEVSDAATSMLRNAVYEKFGFHPKQADTFEAITVLCRTNMHDPVQDYLASLEWDRTPRIDTVLIDYLGAPDTLLNRAMGAKLLCAMVKRAQEPGCKYDLVVALDGEQGYGKSQFTKDLAVFGDLHSLANFSSKSAREQMESTTGKWIVEVAENAGYSKAERNALKAYLTEEKDRARAAYAHFPVDVQRRFIIIVTKNPGGFLNDPTGERRWVPVHAPENYWKKREEFLRNRDQLFAEAVERAKTEPLYLHTPELEAEQKTVTNAAKEENELVDLLHELKGTIIENEERISNQQIRRHLGLEKVDAVRMHGLGRKIADAMMQVGWTKANQPIHCGTGKAERGYWRAPKAKEPTPSSPQLALQSKTGGENGVPY